MNRNDTIFFAFAAQKHLDTLRLIVFDSVDCQPLDIQDFAGEEEYTDPEDQ